QRRSGSRRGPAARRGACVRAAAAWRTSAAQARRLAARAAPVTAAGGHPASPPSAFGPHATEGWPALAREQPGVREPGGHPTQGRESVAQLEAATEAPGIAGL